MNPLVRRVGASPFWFRTFMSLYPPWLGASIRVDHIAPDWMVVQVSIRLRFYNQNVLGVHMGGNLASMTDPFFAIMLIQILGPAYKVVDRSARIDFLKPGRGHLIARFVITPEEVAAIRRATEGGEAHDAEFLVEIRDREGAVIAAAHKTVYVRRRKKA